MMKPRLAILPLVLACACASAANAASILELYDYHGDEVTASARQTWLGLYAGKNGKDALKPSKVSITKVHDQIIDEDDKVNTGKRVSVAGKDKPVFVFSGIRELKAGTISATNVKKEALQIGDNLKLKAGSAEAKLIVKGKKKDKDYYSGYSITLESGGKRQQLVSAPQVCVDKLPSLMWAGDLDGDGKIDLIMDISWHENASDVTLFLSSKAKPGKLVKKAANQYATGC